LINLQRCAILQLMATKNPHAVALGRKGGAATKGVRTERKAAASRSNGKRGGRPPMICPRCGGTASEHWTDAKGKQRCPKKRVVIAPS